MGVIKNHIVIFEHQSIRIDRGDNRINKSQLNALQQFFGEKGVPYFSLIHNGVKFNEYVGVLQIGNTTYEILPKADKNSNSEQWREMLIGMLNAVGVFNIQAPSSSNLSLKTNSILDLYFELFVKELEYLLRRGLIKKYRKTEGNTKALKGSILFSKHLSKNIVHKEQFYVKHTTFDREHKIHKILFKALKVLNQINNNSAINSRIGSLLLDFPEMSDIKVIESSFERIVFDRKTEVYFKSVEIARLILLNYHPDVKHGNNNVLALMFDMNNLWERFVYLSLKKYKSTDTSITAQNTKSFWKAKYGNRSKMRPDIVLNKDRENCIVLDTKWKNLNGHNPSLEDLRQMYVYMKYYNAIKVALVYPGNISSEQSGLYYKEDVDEIGNNECSVISLSVEQNIRQWQKSIYNNVSNFLVEV